MHVRIKYSVQAASRAVADVQAEEYVTEHLLDRIILPEFRVRRWRVTYVSRSVQRSYASVASHG